ncbi:MAG: helix-turn-helix transcriptional regulator [Anaerolineae bacterium]|nr:helix-turn-helix transcriptional regulator [Anaerolineae bacterium]
MMKPVGTSGGNRLRALREFCGRTQLEVELDASLGIGYLQRVESGKVRHPERDTLERILAALGTQYTERRETLELFGYIVDTPLPDAAEIRRAVAECQTDLDSAVFPAYLLDCAHRLLTWNAFVPRLFTRRVFAPQAAPPSMLWMLFDPAYGITARIANPSTFFPAQIRALRYEMRQFGGEPWHEALIDDLLKQCPLFVQHWTEALATHRTETIAARPLVPIELELPNVGTLRFRLTSEPFAGDRRFRLIYYIPADAVTIQQVIRWLDPPVHTNPR